MGSSCSRAEQLEKMRIQREARLGLLSRGLYPANMNFPGCDPIYTDPYAPRLPPHMESREHYSSPYGFTGDYRDNTRHPAFTPPPPDLQRALAAGGRPRISSPPKRAPPKVPGIKKPSAPPPSAVTSAPTRLRWVAPGGDDKEEESSPLDLLSAVRRARRGTAANTEDYYSGLVPPPGGGSPRRHRNNGSISTRAGADAGAGGGRGGSPSKLGSNKGKGQRPSPTPSYGGGRLKPSVEQALIMLEAQETEERAYLMSDELYCYGDILSLFQYALELEVIREAAFELFDFEKSSRLTVCAQERRERQILSYWMQENYDDVALRERLHDVQTRQGTLSPFRGGSSRSYERHYMSPGGSAEDNFNERYWAIRRSNSAASSNSQSQDVRQLVTSGTGANKKPLYGPTNKYTARFATDAVPTAPLVDDSVVLDALQLRDHLGPRVAVAPPPESGYKPLKVTVTSQGERHTTPSPAGKATNVVTKKKKKPKSAEARAKETEGKENRPRRSAPLQPDEDDYYDADDKHENWHEAGEVNRRAAPASSGIRPTSRAATFRSSYSPVPEDPSPLREASMAALHDRFVALLSTPV